MQAYSISRQEVTLENVSNFASMYFLDSFDGPQNLFAAQLYGVFRDP